jgi:hypothetical protein
MLPSLSRARGIVLWLALAVIPLAAQAAPDPAGPSPAPPAAPDLRRPKKLIATGWDQPDTARLREHLALMERRPFDGVVLHAAGRAEDGTPCDVARAFGGAAWRFEWFRPCLDDLKACAFVRFTDNFVLLGANPGDVDWFDDAGWAQVVDHWRIAARIAKAGGLKGILFDPEPYTPPHAVFRYTAQPGRDRRDFGAYAAKARERGREVLRAVAAEYPDVTLFAYFLLSANVRAAGHADPRPVLASQGYGLLPAFLDGWLDVVPPAITIVDGCENAYRYNGALEFLDAANGIRNAAQNLISPENRAKYRAQVQAGFGIYLDAYVNPPGSAWYIDGLGEPRVKRLGSNAAAALRAADEYVWIYGEKRRWWPTPNKGVEESSWPEALPGCEGALRRARDPIDYARARIEALARAGTLANRARNGDFGSGPAAKGAAANGHDEKKGPPAEWGTWQDDKSRGTFAWDGEAGSGGPGAARAAGVANGCFVQSYPATPGEVFAVAAARKLRGRGDAGLRARWQTAEGKWTAERQDVVIPAAGPRDAWVEILGVAEVPQGAEKLVLLLTVAGQDGTEDVAWFDAVRVYPLE